MRVLRSFTLFAVALVVLTLAVALTRPSTPGAAARVAHLESLVRCPSCEDLSVAQSTATSSLAVRRAIARDVAAGRSDTQILTSLESVYGPSILLSPPTSGLGTLLWAVPAVGVLTLGVVVARTGRRR